MGILLALMETLSCFPIFTLDNLNAGLNGEHAHT